MWEKLNIFGWSKKKAAPQPVQREVSIKITNGDQQETIQRSPSGTKIVTSSGAKNRLDDDESSDGSTSINFGLKVGPSSRRSSSFSFSREPLDLPTWSNVTSPGFTSRLVKQASGHSPLKEFNDSLSHSPFRKSPYKDLGLGELPFVNLSRKLNEPHVSRTQSLNRSLRPGVTSSAYNRDRRRNARQGQVFVRITPIDPSEKMNLSINRKSSSPPGGSMAYPNRGSPRSGPDGLGGIPQQELAMRFNRIWPHQPGSPAPGPGRPISPTAPSTILEALTTGRKRGRDHHHDSYYHGPPNATPPSVSPPSKISIGIGDTPIRPHQLPKRVKFIGGPPDNHDRPMMVPFSGIGGDGHEPLSSESILEQMNQTEKRFLPEATSTPYALHKKGMRMSDDIPSGSSTPTSNGMRKRRPQSNVINPSEEEARGDKQSRYCCPCNECYAEAAGNSLDQSKNKSASSNNSDSDSSPSKDSSKSNKTTCDVGISTDSDRAAYFREIFKLADQKKRPKKVTAKDPLEQQLMNLGKTVITKEMYDRDKQKRIERYYRILKLNPPGSSLSDKSGDFSNDNAKQTDKTGSSTTGESAPLSNVQPAATTSGFTFGKQSSPVAQTTTTNSCPTITSPSITASLFGSSSGGVASIAPMPVLNTSFSATPTPSISFGASSSSNAAATTTTTAAATAIPSFGTGSGSGLNAVPPTAINFSSGSNPLAKPKPVETPATTTATVSSSSSGGFNFSGAAAAPSFGSFSGSQQQTTSASPAPTFTGFGSTTTTAPGTTTTTTSLAAPSSGGFSFGGDKPSVTSTTSASTAASPAPAFTFGSNQTTSAPTSVPSIFGLGNKPTDSVDNKEAQPSAAPSTGLFSGVSTTVPSTSNNSGTTASVLPSTANKDVGGFGSTTNPLSTTPGFSFGNVGQSTANTTSGGFNFSGGSTQAATTTSVFGAPISTSQGTSSSGLSIFGSTTATPQATTTPALNLSSTTSNSNPPLFGSSVTSPSKPPATTTPGGFSFAAIPNPLANKGNTNNNNNASTTTAAAPVFGGFGNITSPANNTTTSAPTFGAGVTSPQQSVFGASLNNSTTSTGGPGTSTGIFGQNPSAFGSSFGSSAQPATTTSSGSGGGFSFGNTTTPANTTSSAFPSQPKGVSVFGASSPPTGAFGSAPATTTTGGGASTGGFNFGGSGTFGSTTAAPAPSSAPSAAPTFGSFGGGGAASPPVFGGGAVSTTAPATTNAGFSFGQSTLSPPQANTGSGTFVFGGGGAQANPASQQAPAATGFNFGQSSATPTQLPQPNAAGVVQFGQQQPNSGSTPFQFGQQAAQGVPGGFNFAAATPPAGGQPMFNLGTSSTAPRRRDVRRRYR